MAVMAAAAAVAHGAANTFITTWKSPDAEPISFGGKRVAALVIVDDDDLRMSAEEALAREITARGPRGVAAYRLIPREELTDKNKARVWFEKAGVDGIVILRLVAAETEKVYSSVVWTSGYYANVWDYYGYGWTTTSPIGTARDETTVTVETLLYDLGSAHLIWAGVSRTTDPKDVGSFMKELAVDVVKELDREGLARTAAR